MNITWVTRSFLDYRVPVFAELDKLCDNHLTLIYNKEIVPERCQNKINLILGNRAIGLTGEVRLTGKNNAPIDNVIHRSIRIPYQPNLLKTARETKPDVTVSDGFFQWTYASLLLRVRNHIPHMMCYEPTKITEAHAQFFRTWYRQFVSRWIDHICCNGSLCKEYTMTLGYPESQISTGQMAADSEQLAQACKAIPPTAISELRVKYGLENKLIFLYVGRLIERKGLRQLLEAWDVAKPDAVLLLVGDGPERQTLEDFCKQHRTHGVVFAGAIDYDSIAIFYKSANCFIIPTLQDNWSLVVPEAMSCGLPVATSIYNGCHPELIHPENGWIFDPYNTQDTAEVLKRIVTHKADLPAMGDASRTIISSFTPRQAAIAIYNACQQAICHLSSHH
jgi:glycosyltransferase involved in cell wall biosynthesis